MNCPKCDASIDYRYYAVCPLCESELTPGGPPEDCIPTSNRQEITEVKLRPRDHIANAFLVLMCSGVGSFLGAVGGYVTCGIMYLMFFRSIGPLDCATGTALAMLSILFGGLLGCTGGAIFGYRNRPVCASSTG